MKTNKKVITIIIPTYNMEKYLRHCLDSLIVPNMDKVEVLVINDGSKDSSSAIGHEYQDKYPQTFRVIDKENGNYGSCVNRGLKEASGKYVKVLDADDSFDSINFNKFILHLDTIDTDFVLTDFKRIDEDGRDLYETKYCFRPGHLINLKQITKKYPIGFDMHAATYKTRLLKDINYEQPTGISYTDQIWMQEPFAYIKSAVYVPLMIYIYLIGREGQTMDPKISHKNMASHKTCALSMLQRAIRYPKDNSIGKVFMYKKAIHTIDGIYKTYIFNDKSLGLDELISFDNEIKVSNPYAYKLLDDIVFNKFIGYHYIKKWRHSPNSYLGKQSSFLYRISILLDRISNFIDVRLKDLDRKFYLLICK